MFTLFHGDSRKLDLFGIKNIDLTVTSPPYFVGKQYEEYIKSFKKYFELLKLCFTQVIECTKEGGVVAVNIAHNPKVDTSSYLSVLLSSVGWEFREHIIWQKPSFSPRFGSFVQNPYSTYYKPNLIHEDILIYSKGEVVKRRENKIDIDWAKKYRNDIWEEKAQTKNVGHEAPYPVELVIPIIVLYSCEEDTVLDPFIGSGTTAIAATKLNRKCIGVELEEKYCKLTVERYRLNEHSYDASSKV